MPADIPRLFKAAVFDFTADPLRTAACYRYDPEGALAVCNGLVLESGSYAALRKKYLTAETVDYSGRLLLPGFIDTHIHFPQTEMIGSYGRQLLDWLHEYTFPLEAEFCSPLHAARIARVFVNELFRNGTTACMAYATGSRQSAEALFEAASAYDMCLFAGNVLMDTNVPAALTAPVETAEKTCRDLIARWHGKGRNTYVLTPRFALSCSREEMRMAAALFREFPGTYIQTHLSENRGEAEQVRKSFPESRDYLGVYEQAGLLTERTVFAHGVHLSGSEFDRIARAGAVIAHCPTSNLFLGSGLFPMEKANRHGAVTTIATDVGAGTSFSLLRTLAEAYKVQQLNGYPMTPFEAFYKITLGAARALHADDRIGNFDAGKAADFVVLDPGRPYLQQLRTEYRARTGRHDVEGLLFGLQMLGDDRNVIATYVAGNAVYSEK